jgi:hypothetical protein
MSEPLSLEEFAHLYEDGLKNLEIEKGKLLEVKQEIKLEPLDTDLMSTLTSIFEKLSAAQERGPEEAFKTALEAINVVDAKKFILENLLEGMKREDNVTIQQLMTRYQKLGLLSEDPPPIPPNQPPLQKTIALVERKSIWERVGIAVAQLSLVAFKAIPKFVDVEPSLTFIGPIPCLSFNLKGKAINGYEILETARKAVSARW